MQNLLKSQSSKANREIISKEELNFKHHNIVSTLLEMFFEVRPFGMVNLILGWSTFEFTSLFHTTWFFNIGKMCYFNGKFGRLSISNNVHSYCRTLYFNKTQ